jgi:hypothetical protein
METIGKKKLSGNIERTKVDGFSCLYQYTFSTNQWLESVDNMEYFNIDHNSTKQIVIDSLVDQFRLALNSVVFGDPVGIEYVEFLASEKNKQ